MNVNLHCVTVVIGNSFAKPVIVTDIASAYRHLQFKSLKKSSNQGNAKKAAWEFSYTNKTMCQSCHEA